MKKYLIISMVLITTIAVNLAASTSGVFAARKLSYTEPAKNFTQDISVNGKSYNVQCNISSGNTSNNENRIINQLRPSAPVITAKEITQEKTAYNGGREVTLHYAAVRINWKPIKNAKDYIVKKEYVTGEFDKIGFPTTETSFIDDDVDTYSDNTQSGSEINKYRYVVVAENGFGISDNSNVVEVTIETKDFTKTYIREHLFTWAIMLIVAGMYIYLKRFVKRIKKKNIIN